MQPEQPGVVLGEMLQPLIDHDLVGQLVAAVVEKVGVLEDRVVARAAGEHGLDAGSPRAQKNIVDVVRLEQMRAGVHRDVRARAASPRARAVGQIEPRRRARAVIGFCRYALLQQRSERRRAGGDRGAHAVLIDAVDYELNDDGIGDFRGRTALRDKRRGCDQTHRCNNGRDSHTAYSNAPARNSKPAAQRRGDAENETVSHHGIAGSATRPRVSRAFAGEFVGSRWV